jgi:hypothetical protein
LIVFAIESRIRLQVWPDGYYWNRKNGVNRVRSAAMALLLDGPPLLEQMISRVVNELAVVFRKWLY